MADDADFRLECYRLAVSAGFTYDAAAQQARSLYEWATGRAYGAHQPAAFVAYTKEEGGEFLPIDVFPKKGAQVFAMKGADGWIWDPITGWRKYG